MKKVILSLCCIFSGSFLNINAGVESTTLVHTPQGLRHINALSVGDEIVCRNQELEKTTKAITAIETHHYEACIEVTMADNKVMRLSHDQRVFTPFKWTPAECLSIGDALMNEERQFVRIKSIEYKEESIDLHFIEVDQHKNFMIGESGILVHNGPICGFVTYWGIKGGAYFGICAGTAVVVGTGAGVIAATAGAVGTTAGSMATAAIACAAPVGSVGTVIGAGTMTAAGTMGATTAGVATASVAAGIQSAGVIAATAVAVESAAFSAGLAVTACPFLP